MVYVHYDKDTGKIYGYFTKEVNGDNIPAPNIEISEEQWKEALSNLYNFINPETKEMGVKDFRTVDEIKDDLLKIDLPQKFKQTLSQGYVTSVSDKHFYAQYEDIQKLKSGYDLAVLGGSDQMEVKTLDGVITLSVDDVKKALAELGQYYQKMLQKKWDYEKQINDCQDIDCLKNITIDFSDVANSDSSS